MTNSQRLSTVRSALRSWIRQQVDEPDCKITSESFLIREGFFCGRSFQTESFRATWFIEQDELKIHSAADGSLLCVMNSEEIQAAADHHPDVLSMPQPQDTAGEVDNTDDGDEQDLRRAA